MTDFPNDSEINLTMLAAVDKKVFSFFAGIVADCATVAGGWKEGVGGPAP